MVRHGVILCLLALFCSALQAGPPPASQAAPGAEGVARAYLLAIRAQGFAANADFMDPEELARFKAMLMPVFDAQARAGSRALINATFGYGATLAEVRQATPVGFMRHLSRVMAARMPKQSMDFTDLKVLGAIPEKDRTYVLVRTRVDPDEPSTERVIVVTLHPYEGTWKLALSADMKDAAQSLGQPTRHPHLEPRHPCDDQARSPVLPTAPEGQADTVQQVRP
jgi:hypothetical protein